MSPYTFLESFLESSAQFSLQFTDYPINSDYEDTVTKLVINLPYNLVNNALSLEIIQITQTRLAFSSIH